MRTVLWYIPEIFFSNKDKIKITENSFAVLQKISVVLFGIFSANLKFECFSVLQKYLDKNSSGTHIILAPLFDATLIFEIAFF